MSNNKKTTKFVGYFEHCSDTLDEIFHSKKELINFVEKSKYDIDDITIHKVTYSDIENIKVELDFDTECHKVFVDCLIDDKKTTSSFIVQVSNAGDYEPQNGCYFHGCSDNDFSHNEFSMEEKLISKCIDIPSLVEDEFKGTYELYDAGFHCAIDSRNLYIKENATGDEYTIVTLNESHNSSFDYGEKMKEYDSFDSHEEAMEFLEQFRTNEHYDCKGFYNFLKHYNDDNE